MGKLYMQLPWNRHNVNVNHCIGPVKGVNTQIELALYRTYLKVEARLNCKNGKITALYYIVIKTHKKKIK